MNKEIEHMVAFSLLWKLRTRMNVLSEMRGILQEYICEHAKREEDGSIAMEQGDDLVIEIMAYLEEDI